MGFLIEGIVGRAWLTGNVFVCVSTQVDERGQADDGHYYHAAVIISKISCARVGTRGLQAAKEEDNDQRNFLRPWHL